MATIQNKASLQNILQQVLSVGDREQNMSYPPSVYSNHYNIVTSFLLDGLSKIYPSQIDSLLTFIQTEKIKVTNGYVQMPQEYRNLLGAPSISVKPDGSDCSSPDKIDTSREFNEAILKSGCKTTWVDIVDKNEWDARTTSTYAFPTYDLPIALWIGEKRLKVCPYNLQSVEVTFVKREKIYDMAYEIQPDDTYIYKEEGTVQSEWDNAAAAMIFKGVLSLYSAYVRDNTISDYSKILNQIGLF